MIELTHYITEENIVDLESVKYEDINSQLVDNCLKDFSENEKKQAIEQLNKINHGKGINLSKGFALVHLRIDYLKKIRLSLGILPTPIKEKNTDPIHAIFCILIPHTKCRTYLSLMAHLTRFLSQPDAKNVFKHNNKQQIVKFVRQFEEVGA